MSAESNRRGFLAASAVGVGAALSAPAALAMTGPALGQGQSAGQTSVKLASSAKPATELAGAVKSDIPFSLGIVTYNIAAEWDLDTILKVLPKTNVRHVEFRTTHKHGVEPTLSKQQRQDVKKRCADAGITIWGLGSVCEFHSPDANVVKEHIESCKRFLELAHDLDARGVKIRPNGLRKDISEEQTLEQIGKALIPCGKAAGDLGREVWVEVHGSETAKPPRMKAIMDHCGHSSVGICWNSNRDDLVDGSIQTSFDLLAPWIKSCHINTLYSDYPYRELFRNLKSIGYDRVTLIEIGEKLDPQNGELLLKYYHRLWHELCS